MAFNRFDDRRSTYNFEKTPSRGRTFFRGAAESPLFKRKFLNSGSGNASMPSSVASSRESSLDRGGTPTGAPAPPNLAFHQVVGRVMSSPKMSLRKKFQVMRSGSFNDSKSYEMHAKRKQKWLLERSGSLRLPGKYNKSKAEVLESPWSSPENDRRGSLDRDQVRDRSLDRVGLLERRGSYNPNERDLDSGKIKGFVNRWFRHIQEASNAYRVRDPNRRSRYPADPLNGVENSGKTDDHLGLPDVDKKGQPAGRSQSFHESSTSSRELHSDRQPSSPPEERGGDSHAKKAEKIRRKDLEVARALEEKHRLVSEYYQIPFLEAQQPTENNSAVATIAAAVSSSGNESEDADANRDAREVLLAALVQVKSLSDLVNESLTLSEEDAVAVASTSRLSPAAVAPSAGASSKNKDAGQPASEPSVPSLSSLASEAVEELPSVKLYKRLHPPTHKLIAITKNMNQHLTSLLEIIQDRDEERERLRKELSRAQDQVHTLLSQSSVRTSSLSVTSPASRPASFISIEESSGPETSERNQESEDDGASITTIPTTQKSSDTDDTSITVAKEIEIPIEVEKSNKPLNGEEVTLPTPEPSSPNETSELSEPESKSTVIDTDETTKNSEEDDEEEEADKTIDDNTEDDSAV